MTALPTPSSRSQRRPLAPPRSGPMLRPDLRTTTPPRRSDARGAPTLPKGPSSQAARFAKAALLAGVAAASAFGVVKVKSVVEHSDVLPLRTISVVGVAADSARAAEVKAWTELDVSSSTGDGSDGNPGVPFFGIDTDAIAARVEQHPFIGDAHVRRLPPDTLEITVTERSPRAAVRTEDGVYLVDENGEVMKRARPGDALDIPVLSLLEVTKNAPALALVRALEVAQLLSRASEVVEHPASLGFDVVFDDGARVRVGSGDFDQKLARLVKTERELAAHGRSFSFMWLDDARHPERVAVRLRPPTETSAGGG